MKCSHAECRTRRRAGVFLSYCIISSIAGNRVSWPSSTNARGHVHAFLFYGSNKSSLGATANVTGCALWTLLQHWTAPIVDIRFARFIQYRGIVFQVLTGNFVVPYTVNTQCNSSAFDRPTCWCSIRTPYIVLYFQVLPGSFVFPYTVNTWRAVKYVLRI